MKSNKTKEVYLCGGFGNIMFQFVLINRLTEMGHNVVIYDNFIKNNIITRYILRWKIQNDFYRDYFKKNNIIINHSSFFKSLIDLLMLSLSNVSSVSSPMHIYTLCRKLPMPPAFLYFLQNVITASCISIC